MSNMACGLCRGLGRIKDYDDEWPCPSCNPERTFKTVLGLTFKDHEGEVFNSWQMVCEQDGLAYATFDIRGSNIHSARFLCADSVEEIAEEWKRGLLREVGILKV